MGKRIIQMQQSGQLIRQKKELGVARDQADTAIQTNEWLAYIAALLEQQNAAAGLPSIPIRH